jgi:hypothetical protein
MDRATMGIVARSALHAGDPSITAITLHPPIDAIKPVLYRRITALPFGPV